MSLLARLILGVVFLIASVDKILNPLEFANQIENYGILFDSSINLMALVLPWLELVIGVFLVLGIRLKTSAVLSGILLIIFIAALLIATLKGINADCGCGTGGKIGWEKIIEDIALLICSIYIFYFPVKKLTLENLIKREI